MSTFYHNHAVAILNNVTGRSLKLFFILNLAADVTEMKYYLQNLGRSEAYYFP